MSTFTRFTTLSHEVIVTSSLLMPLALPSNAPPNLQPEVQFPMLNIKLINKTNKSLTRREKHRMEARAPDIWLEHAYKYVLWQYGRLWANVAVVFETEQSKSMDNSLALAISKECEISIQGKQASHSTMPTYLESKVLLLLLHLNV